jgi:cytochrome b561
MVMRYTYTAIALHWLIALAIATAAMLGLYMAGLSFSPQKLRLYSWHKWIGVTIFLLAVGRLLWRLTHSPPPLPNTMPRWQRGAALGTHAALYVLVLIIPLSGWLMSSALGVKTVYLGLIPLPDLLAKNKPLGEALKAVHVALNWTLAAVVLVHAGAALKHHLVERDEVLHRMLPLVKPRVTRVK